MFLFDFADYRDTLIIFGVVVLVIVLVYFIFFAPKNKSKGEVIVKHEEEHFELEEKFNENEINDEDFNEVQEETVVTPVLSEASVEAVAFEDESQEIEEIVSEEGVSVEDELNDEVVSSVEIEETIDKNSLDQETKDEVDQDINVELNDDDDEIEETVDEDKKELGKYHVLYRKDDNKWYVKREGSDKVLRVLETQKEAIAWATIKALNQDTSIVIHKRDGKIRKQNY
ncbi:MAG: DUF2188 domain-containing protein [Candidatus Izemoplasmatales bacterium]|nr:DUF2188 domain-containing protein [Candidatus Izemoplasmatales bacterium]MDD4069533.1 DUF2188 domain-containing protein [Candidatus Izemoplasmatales bacterium]